MTKKMALYLGPFTKRILWMLSCLFLTSCNSINTVANAEGHGVRRHYNVSQQVLWPHIKRAVTGTGGQVKEVRVDQQVVLARYASTISGNPDFVAAIFCKPDGSSGSTIEIIMRPTWKTYLLHDYTPDSIFSYIDQRIK